jgi:hypothetical protein
VPATRIGRFLRHRPWVLAALLYGVLSLLLVSPALWPGRTLSSSDGLWNASPWRGAEPAGVNASGSNPELGDAIRVFQPFVQYTHRTLPDIPLWNPFVMGGRPFLGDGQSGVFSPFNVPSYVLPFWSSLAIVAALKVFTAAFGTFLLARSLRIGPGAGVVAGLVFGFSFWFVAWLSWPTTDTWAFLPWLWLMTDQLVRRPSLLTMAGLATVVGLQFLGGHPGSILHALAATVVVLALRLAVLAPSERRLGWAATRASWFAAAALLGTALAALTLVPFAELLTHSADVSARSRFGDLHEPGRYLLGVFLHDWWGRPTRTWLELGRVDSSHAYYVGALPLMLAATALVRPRLERLGFAAIGALALGISLGAPLVFDALRSLPGFSVTQNARLAVVYVLCAALLAAWGLDDLVRGLDRPRAMRSAAALSVAVLVAPFVWVLAAGARPPASLLDDGLRIAWGFGSASVLRLGASLPELRHVQDQIRMASLCEWLVPAAVGVALVLGRLRGRLGPRLFTALATALVALDLFKAGMGFNPAIDRDAAIQPVTPALRRLQADGAARFVGLDPTAPFSPKSPLLPDVAVRYGLFDARGYDFPVEERFLRLWRQEVAPGCVIHFCTTGATATPRTLRAFNLFGVRSLLQQPIDARLRLAGVHVAYDGRDARIYTNDHALPRALVLERQVVAEDDRKALRRITSPSFDPRRAVVTTHPIAGVATSGGRGRPAPAGATVTTYEAERVVARATAPRTSVLMLTDVFYPGWRARVDGKGAPIERVDYLFRGVRLTPGRHVVEFRYEPASWRVGLAVSGLAVLVLVVTAAFALRARRRSRIRVS